MYGSILNYAIKGVWTVMVLTFTMAWMLAIVWSFASVHVRADSVTWDGGGGDTNWDNPVNWSNDTLPGPNDDVTITGAITINLNSATTIRSLTVGNGTTATVLNFNYDAVASGPLVLNAGNLFISASSSITHTVATNGTVVGKVNIDVQAGNATIAGSLNVAAKGYAGGQNAVVGYGPGGGNYGHSCGVGNGGTYGGKSSTNGCNAGDTDKIYGSLVEPTDLGSGGGGGYNNSRGGNGGGSVKLSVAGQIEVTGTINANGGAGSGQYPSGGSGGSIWLNAATITGSGSITANGSNGTGSVNGKGGGGRIALHYTTTFSSSITLEVNPGSLPSNGEHGTTYVINSNTKDLQIPVSNGRWLKSAQNSWNIRNFDVSANVSFQSTNAEVFQINSTGTTTFASNLTITFIGSYTNGSNGRGVFLNLTGDVTIPAGTTLTADARGYVGGYNAVVGSGPGGGGYGHSCGTGHGGSYGGNTGINRCNAVSADKIYGSLTEPIDLGSGGGGGYNNSWGGTGGGAIRISTTGTINNQGIISANGGAGSGQYPSGGSGGSVWIAAASISGSGTIRANGVDGTSGGHGKGGGGRVALYYSNSFSNSLTLEVLPGSLPSTAEYGTTYILNSATSDLSIPVDNGRWFSNQKQNWDFRNLSIAGDVTFNAYNAEIFRITSSGTTTIADNVNIYAKGSYTSDSNGRGVHFNLAGDVVIPQTSVISANGMGYGSAAGLGRGNTGGGSGSGGGGGHGSVGKNGQSGSANGVTYGDSKAPIDLGSGGGTGANGSTGGFGGGAIMISASGNLDIKGTVSANGLTGSGNYRSGGAGGSVYIIAGSVTGGGSVTANGGDGISATYGAGGGGRVAIHSSNYTFSGSIQVNMGLGGAFVGTTVLVNTPTALYGLGQYAGNGTTAITAGSPYIGDTVVIKAMLADGSDNDTLELQVEFRTASTSFQNSATHTQSGINYNGVGVEGAVVIDGLEVGQYHWQARSCDSENNCSAWVKFSNTHNSSYDILIQVNSAPNTPTSLGPLQFTNGTFTTTARPTLIFAISDPNQPDQLKYTVEIDNNSDFSSAEVSYTSNYVAQGNVQYQTQIDLADGGYHWRVKAIDQANLESDWAIGNAGQVSFIVDRTAPSINSLVFSSSTHTLSTWSSLKNVTINWSTIADSGVGLDGYSFHIADSASGQVDTIKDIAAGITSQTVSFANGNANYFNLRAVDKLGNWSSPVSFGPFFIDAQAPTAPPAPSVSTTNNNLRPVWTWAAVDDQASGLNVSKPYTVQWCSTNAFPSTCNANVVDVSTNSFQQSSNLAEGSWYLRVKSRDRVGNESNYSASTLVTIVAPIVVPPPAPVAPTPTVTPIAEPTPTTKPIVGKDLETADLDKSEDKASGEVVPNVEVKLTDSSGKPLANATVRIPEKNITITTDENGIVRFQELKKGNYTLIVTKGDQVQELDFSVQGTSDENLQQQEIKVVQIESGNDSSTSSLQIILATILILTGVSLVFSLLLPNMLTKVKSGAI